MPDWTRSMKQTYEYFEVDPGTWRDKRRVENVESCTITRDSKAETLGSSSINCADDLSDIYVRTYLITEQDGRRERTVLGTNLYESPSVRFDGKRESYTQDGYTPLIELKEKIPPVGFSVLSGTNIMATVGTILSDKKVNRIPYIVPSSDHLLVDNFVSEDNDTWLYFIQDLANGAKYDLGLDETGKIIFEKQMDTSVMTPRWTFTDDNSSILQPEIEVSRDLYGVPNVVEVVYSPPSGNSMFAEYSNDSPDSVVSTVNRGRRVVYRETDPSIAPENGTLTQDQLDSYAKDLLSQKSSLEYEVTYTHGYCPVRVGDAVRLNYERAGLRNVVARVTKQVIDCRDGCQVQETAVFTKKLWE